MSKTINTSLVRVGNITSSEIVALTGMGSRKMTEEELEEYKRNCPKGRKTTIEHWPNDTAINYISECNMERRLLRSISDEVSARALCWGNLVEMVAFDRLGMEYIHSSQETIVHSALDFWVGSPDGFKEDEGRTVIDIKCPMTLKSFCTFADCIELVEVDGVWIQDGLKSISNVRDNHNDGDKYYWQLVSNSIIGNCKYAELIIYMPYKSELQEIRELAGQAPEDVLYKFFWIANANDEELPHLIEGGYYKNLYTIRFEVPEADKDFLIKRVMEAGRKLQPFYKPTITAI
jgi:hypothetical protein